MDIWIIILIVLGCISFLSFIIYVGGVEIVGNLIFIILDAFSDIEF
jgi:hypothetical protein